MRLRSLLPIALFVAAPLAAQTPRPSRARPTPKRATPARKVPAKHEAARKAPPRPAPPVPRPKLVVFFTIDQMRPDYFERFDSQLTGGLVRLYHNGAVFTEAYQDHAITETAPGHSVTLSGRFPRSTGIVANSMGVEDPQKPLVGGGGPGASPFRFRGTTLIDWMRIDDPRSRALSVSRKDRGAILPLGRAEQSVFWYGADGRFTTSSYYADTLPTWVRRFNARDLVRQYAGDAWTPLLPAREYPEPDSVPQENRGEDYTFPHVLPRDRAQAARALPGFPWMDEVTLQLALDGLQAMQLGTGPQTDLLAISLSTTDAIGHAYGPDSRELHDQIIRLDRYLGIFIDSLYKLRDSSTIVFALTADHGVAPFPELRAARLRTVARRPDIRPLVAQLDSSLDSVGAPGAMRYEDGMLFADRDSLRVHGLDADSIARWFTAQARKLDGISRAELVSALARRDTVRDDVSRRWLHMLPPDLPVVAVVSLAPYAYWKQTTYATHGTPNDIDAHVPMIFYGPWVEPGMYGGQALVADIAPTLARIIGVTPTEKLDGKVRQEILKSPTATDAGR